MAKQRRAHARPPAKPRRGRPAPRAAKPPRRPGPPPAIEHPAKTGAYLEAVATYERGLDSLQRHDFATAAARFREVLERYPDERELHERVRLYLKVCERQQQPKASAPQTLEERVYAATIALNAGRDDEALSLLTRTSAATADNGHVQYMLAVVHARRGSRSDALACLRRAAELDPENRSLARRDVDFEDLHDDEEFLRVTATVPAGGRRRARARGAH